MEEFQSILLEDLEIRWPDFCLRRIALNQHMPRVERLSEHRHDFHQILLYLRGKGTQHLEEEAVSVERGTALFVPAGTRHRFEKERQLRPVCLAIDFEGGISERWNRMGGVSGEGLALIERWLVELHALEKYREENPISIAACVLRTFDFVQRTLILSKNEEQVGPVGRRVEGIVKQRGLAGLTPGIVAECLGRSLDHLNRQLKGESGLTVGQWIDRERLAVATRCLRSSNRPIGEIASEAGFDDQNYFSRWFRKETGQTPTRWREAMQE